MSNVFYDKLWHLTQQNVEELLALDETVQVDKTPRAKRDALKKILPVYIKCRNMVKKLAQLYDQMIHSQKREIVKRLLDCYIGRMLEYRKEIVKLNCSEYEWFDDLLIEMKSTSDDVEIPSISSYIVDRKNELEYRERYIEDILEKLNTPEAVQEDEKETDSDELQTTMELTRSPSETRAHKSVKAIRSQIPLSIEAKEARIACENAEKLQRAFSDAILLIQRHERARANRVVATDIESSFNYRRKLRYGAVEPKMYKKKVTDRAAARIQKVWRGHRARQLLKKRQEETEMVLGMILPRWKDKTVLQEDLSNMQRRQQYQAQFKAEVQELIDQRRNKIFDEEGATVIEDTSDEIRAWFQEWLATVGHFDIFPPVQNGGSRLIAMGQTLTPEEFLVKKLEEKREAKGEKNKEDKKDKKEKKEEKKSTKGKDKGPEGWTMQESKVLQMIGDIKYEFTKSWSLRNVEDLHQQPNDDLIKERIYHDLQLEMREVVDELMALELDRMNEALIKDHKNDKEKFEFPGMKKGKKKKGGKEDKGGKKKKRKGVEVLNKEGIDKMFDELVAAGIIRNYPDAKLDDWFGDMSYQNFEAKKDLRDYSHRLGEIKHVIMDTCILPLGSKYFHTFAPLIRSVCIVGLPRTGKTFLASAIANEIGALLFDLTPSVLAGQYEGKKNEENLMKMINAVARTYPPSIVLIDGGEKPWWKKIPPEERETQPKRLAKLLPKFIKGIKPGDQLLVLGLASQPWKAANKFCTIYETFVTIPVSDYNTVYLFYQDILMKYHNVDRNFDASSLTQVSIGYPLDVIRETVESVLTLRRRMTLKFQPLKPEEILLELQKYPRASAKVLQQYKKFKMKTPLGKKWAKMMKEQTEEIESPKGKQK